MLLRSSRLPSLLAFVTALWTFPLQAQSAAPSYQIPCQPRGAFVSRLRSLVRDPDSVEVALTRFSIVASQDTSADQSGWTLLVARTGAQSEEPRAVRDTTCEALAEAAALVVAAWIDATPLPPSAAACPPTAVAESAADVEPHNGIALSIENASALAPRWSVGATLGLWHMQTNDVWLHTLSLSLWPGSFGLNPAPGGPDYKRPVFEFGYMLGAYFVRFGAVSLGLGGSLRVGIRPRDGGAYETVLRGILFVPVRWNISGPWNINVRAGITDGPDSNSIGFDGSVGLSWSLI